MVPECTRSHYTIHHEALAVKNIPNAWKMVPEQVVKIVNFTKSRQLHLRILRILCDKIGSSCKMLLLHMETECSSQGTVLVCVFILRLYIMLFGVDHPFQLSS
jgi:hypothetical protein